MLTGGLSEELGRVMTTPGSEVGRAVVVGVVVTLLRRLVAGTLARGASAAFWLECTRTFRLRGGPMKRWLAVAARLLLLRATETGRSSIRLLHGLVQLALDAKHRHYST